MAVAYDNGSEGTITAGPLSYSHTIGGNANRVLYVTAWSANENDMTAAVAKYNTVTMTQVYHQTNNNEYRAFRLWRLNEADLPSTGAYTVEISGVPNGISSIGASVYNANQSDPDDDVQTNLSSGTSTLINATSESGDLVMDICVEGGSVTNFAPGGSQSLINIVGESAGGTYKGGMSYRAGAASVAMSWSWTEVQGITHVTWNINAAAGANDLAADLDEPWIGGSLF